jgi:FkbM family methyltransferase
MDKSYFNEHDESHAITINAINQLSPGNRFVDVGANIGYFSFLASRKVGEKGRVFSFEPSKREYARMMDCQSINQAQNMITYNVALSDHHGILNISTDDFHTGLNSITYQQDGQRQQQVQCNRLDELLEEEHIDLVKIDVEGAELKVLRGAKKLLESKSIAKLIIEITPKFLAHYGDSREALYDFLRQYEYYPVLNKQDWQYDEIFILKNGVKK